MQGYYLSDEQGFLNWVPVANQNNQKFEKSSLDFSDWTFAVGSEKH